MEKKQIQVTCPCCSSELQVDVLTEQVVRSVPKAELDAAGRPVPDEGRWDRLSEKVEQRSSGAEDKLESALEAERNKADRFDDLFDAARDRVREREERDLDG